MRAHEKRVIVHHLSARRLIVRIIQPDQSIAQERSELAASLSDFRRGGLGLEYLGQIRPHLHDCVAVSLESRGIFTFLSRGKKGIWRFQFPNPSLPPDQ